MKSNIDQPIWQCSVICHMNNHIFFSQFNRHVLHSRERNIMFLSALWWLTVFSELAGSCLAASAAQSCMGLGKHGLTHWDPRSTGLANNCHHILLIFCEIALGWILEVGVTSHAQIRHIVLGCLASFSLFVMFNLCAWNVCENRRTITKFSEST